MEHVISGIKPMMLKKYYVLTKPKVVLLIVFTAVVGMLLVGIEKVPLSQVFAAITGIALASASGAAINHWVDQKIDEIMERTKNRPIPHGDLNPTQAGVQALAAYAAALRYDRRQALEHLEQALELGPKRSKVHFRAARVLSRLGDTAEAIERQRKAMARMRARRDRSRPFIKKRWPGVNLPARRTEG